MLTLRNAFLSPVEGRLRAGWRLAAAYALMLVAFLPLQLLIRTFAPADWTRGQRVDVTLLGFAIAATAAIILARRRVDRRPLSSIGLVAGPRAVQDVLAGFAISLSLVAAILVIGVAAGWMRYPADQPDAAVALPRALTAFFFSGVVVSWWENLFFVAYLLVNLKEGVGMRWAVAINLAVFSAVHLANPSASVWAFLGIVIIHGYELFAFVRTRTLWLVFGIHAGWNFGQALAGFAVSGRSDLAVFSLQSEAPRWFIGDAFGPESGSAMVLTGAMAFAMIRLYTRHARPRLHAAE